MYSDIHRTLAQHILIRGYVKCNDALTILKKFPETAEAKEPELDQYISLINEKISKLYQHIRKAVCEHSGVKYYIMISTIENDITKLQKHFSEKDLEFFKLIIDELVYSENAIISMTKALSLVRQVKNGSYSRDQAEYQINQLVMNGFLWEQSDKLSFGIRGIYDLEPLFRKAYKDHINDCPLCKEIVFFGKTCMNCEQVIHMHCLNRYLSERRKCPSCKTDWSEKCVSVNDETEEEGEDSQ